MDCPPSGSAPLPETSVIPQAQLVMTPHAAKHVGSVAGSQPARTTPVLITEQEVVFGTAAAMLIPRTTARPRIARALRRIQMALLPRRRHQSRHDYQERWCMAREMLRL